MRTDNKQQSTDTGKGLQQQIIEAWVRIRKIDSTIPDDILDLMKNSALQYDSLCKENEQLKDILQWLIDLAPAQLASDNIKMIKDYIISKTGLKRST